MIGRGLLVATALFLALGCMPRSKLLPKAGEERAVLWYGTALQDGAKELARIPPGSKVKVREVTAGDCVVVVDGPVALVGNSSCADLGYVVTEPSPVYRQAGDASPLFEVNGGALVAPQRPEGNRILVEGRNGVAWNGWLEAGRMGTRRVSGWPDSGAPGGLWSCEPQIPLFDKPNGKVIFELPAVPCRLKVLRSEGEWAEADFDDGVLRARGWVERRQVQAEDRPIYDPAARPLRTAALTQVYADPQSTASIATIAAGVTVWASLESGKRIRVQTILPHLAVIGWVDRESLKP